MKVIGSGLPRTGTLSQKVALDMLGFGPCYHMVNVLADLEHTKLWQAALEGEPDWERVFEGFESTVDWPGGYFYKQLMDLYPDAKVLHSVRNPDAWEKSMRETVWGIVHGDNLIGHLSNARSFVDAGWAEYLQMVKGLLWNEGTGTLAKNHQDKDGLIAASDAHTEEVMRVVPAERLLIWDVTQGWEPLCEFLEVDVPAEPVPHVNDGVEFKRRVIEMSLVKLQAYWDEHGGPVTGATPAQAAAAH